MIIHLHPVHIRETGHGVPRSCMHSPSRPCLVVHCLMRNRALLVKFLICIGIRKMNHIRKSETMHVHASAFGFVIAVAN